MNKKCCMSKKNCNLSSKARYEESFFDLWSKFLKILRSAMDSRNPYPIPGIMCAREQIVFMNKLDTDESLY